MEMTKYKVTPEMAEAWLDTVNVANRSLTKRKVLQYASDLASNNWRNTHQNAIAFYDDGVLADGQHRLAAILATGVSVEMFVATGLSRADGSAIDQGRSRSVVDALKIGGLLTNDKYSTYAVAIVKLIYAVEVGETATLSVREVADAIETMRPGIEFSCTNLANIQGIGLKNTTMRTAVAVASYHVNNERLAQFCRVMVSGMPEDGGDAMLIRLRNHILVNGVAPGSTGRLDRYKLILKAIDVYSKHGDAKVFRRVSATTFKLGLFNEK